MARLRTYNRRRLRMERRRMSAAAIFLRYGIPHGYAWHQVKLKHGARWKHDRPF